MYAAVDEIRALRAEAERVVGEIRADGEAVAASDAELVQRNEELKVERARITSAYQALRADEESASEESRSALGAWNERRAALVSERVKAVEGLEAVYAARLALTSEEFEQLQGVLLALLRDEASVPASRSDTAMLHAELVRAAAHAGLGGEDSLLQQNALFELVANEADTAARSREPEPHGRWESYRGQPIAERRKLEGERKRTFIRSWFDALAARAPVARLRERLLARPIEVEQAQVEQFLGALFETGLYGHAQLIEVRFDGGTMGAQAVVLDNRYWVDAGGHLERIPEL